MKKQMISLLVIVLMSGMILSACQSVPSDPGAPPESVINPSSTDATVEMNSQASAGVSTADEGLAQDTVLGTSSDNVQNQESAETGGVMEETVLVQIGENGSDELSVYMFDNAAAQTLMSYLSDSQLRFPAYTYDEAARFTAQNVRGTYTRDDEVTITDVKSGELYLFSGGQLRLYFKDVPGADITATPVGVFADTSVVEDAVVNAYESNQGDTWGVAVYFLIRKE